MIFYYSRSCRGYIDDRYPFKSNKHSNKYFKKLIASGKCISLYADKLYPAMSHNSTIFITKDTIKLVLAKPELCFFAYQEYPDGSSLLRIELSGFKKQKDAFELQKLVENNQDYSLIYKILDSSLPYIVEAHPCDTVKLFEEIESQPKPKGPGKKWVWNTDIDLGNQILNFFRAIKNLIERMDDRGECYYDLTYSDHDYPSLADVNRILSK
jgi:hypothetical protein